MKKKVRFNVSIAGEQFAYKPGDEAYIEAKLADAWSNSGICVVIEEHKAK